MKRHMMHPYATQADRYEEALPDQDNPADLPVPEEETATDETHAEAANEPTPTSAAEQDKLKAELDEERLRMAAEMENFKKRLRREHEEQMRYASEKVLGDLLPALDNLDLAIQYGSRDEACKDMMQGIEMTRKQLLEAVAKSGLTSVGEKGETFNPAFHEAIGVEADPSQEPGTVSRILQRGYKLNDRLLRPAKVMVNN